MNIDWYFLWLWKYGADALACAAFPCEECIKIGKCFSTMLSAAFQGFHMKKILAVSLLLFLLGCKDRVEIKRMDHSGYKGNVELWKSALNCWRDAVNPDDDFDFHSFDGSKDASELLKKFPDLPLSYIHFIEAGGLHISVGNEMNFLSSDAVGWYRNFGESYDEWKKLVELYLPDVYDENYFSYAPDNLNFNASEFDRTFIVAQEGGFQSALYLLNPVHKSTDGEWEGWYWYPSMTGGVRRYRSFAHLAAQKFTLDKYLKGIGRERSLYFDKEDWNKNCFSELIERKW